ncbi:MAG: DUF3037 domain-containing protein [Chloroflexota bacterium]
MPAVDSYDYALVRLVPAVERGEFMNIGVILFCRRKRFLASRFALEVARISSFAPTLTVSQLQPHLDLIEQICAGGRDSGPIGQLSQAERFHWLVAPKSTIIQPSPVHCGQCTDAQAALDHLFATLVLVSNAFTPDLEQ